MTPVFFPSPIPCAYGGGGYSALGVMGLREPHSSATSDEVADGWVLAVTINGELVTLPVGEVEFYGLPLPRER